MCDQEKLFHSNDKPVLLNKEQKMVRQTTVRSSAHKVYAQIQSWHYVVVIISVKSWMMVSTHPYIAPTLSTFSSTI